MGRRDGNDAKQATAPRECSQWRRASPPPQGEPRVRGRARPIPRGRPVEGHAPSPLGVSRVAWISLYRHAVVNTPVARWVLIARGTAYSTRFPFIPSDGGLPHTDARSATTLDVSRPAQRSLALRPVGSLHRLGCVWH